jgi:hypothetical protein
MHFRFLRSWRGYSAAPVASLGFQHRDAIARKRQ